MQTILTFREYLEELSAIQYAEDMSGAEGEILQQKTAEVLDRPTNRRRLLENMGKGLVGAAIGALGRDQVKGDIPLKAAYHVMRQVPIPELQDHLPQEQIPF